MTERQERQERRHNGNRARLLLIAGLVWSVSAIAAAAPPPTAAQILDKYLDATGGKAAHAAIENRVLRMTMEQVGTGLELDITTYVASPNKTYTVLDSDITGRIEKGTDGQVVWEKTLMTGPVIKDGDERALVLRASRLDKDVNWRDLFEKAECVGIASVDGHACHKVEMTPAQGPVETRYFDQATGLLARVDLTLTLPMGAIPMELFFSDYKEVDGLKFPHRVRRKAAGQEVLITTTSIEHNVDLPADRFRLPDDVQALVTARHKTGSGADGD